MAFFIDWRCWRTRFLGIVLIGFLFTSIALFTGGWSEFKFKSSKKYQSLGQNYYTWEIDILSSRHDIPRYGFEKWCVAAMFFAWFFEIAIIIISILNYTNIKLNINNKSLVLTILSGVATLLILAVVIVYPVKAPSAYKGADFYGIKYSISYSYFLAIFSFIFMLASTISGYFMMREYVEY
uniref:Uncharacterized protein n=1 Tax=Acrobeloides nanus TaxID=290746 RepID=A0A914CS62_9BILA